MNESAVWILNFDYDKVIDIVYPYFKRYADKIGADLNIIDERMYPEWNVIYETAQIYEKGKNYKWNIVIDSDVLLHRNFPDFTKGRLNKYSVGLKDTYPCKDIFKDNKYFYRDGRYIGVSGVCIIVSHYCHDFFMPLEHDQDYYVNEIIMDKEEQQREVDKTRFIAEYMYSLNLAKYGLRYDGLLHKHEFYTFHHPYGWRDSNGVFRSFTTEEKIQNIKNKIIIWKD